MSKLVINEFKANVVSPTAKSVSRPTSVEAPAAEGASYDVEASRQEVPDSYYELIERTVSRGNARTVETVADWLRG